MRFSSLLNTMLAKFDKLIDIHTRTYWKLHKILMHKSYSLSIVNYLLVLGVKSYKMGIMFLTAF